MSFSLDAQSISIIQEFERITRARCKDTFDYKDRKAFIIDHGEIKKALGQKNKNIAFLEKKFNKKIKLVEFNPDVCVFIANFLKPLKISSIELKEDVVYIEGEDTKTQGLIIGARAQNLRNLEEIVKKYFPIREIRVGQDGKEI